VDKPRTEVCDAWPVRRQTYGYLHSRRTFPSRDITAPWLVPNYTAWWQRHVCEQLTQGWQTWQPNGHELNSRSLNTLTITPPGHSRCGSWKLRTFNARRCQLSSVTSSSHWVFALSVCSTFTMMQCVAWVCQRQLILVS